LWINGTLPRNDLNILLVYGIDNGELLGIWGREGRGREGRRREGRDLCDWVWVGDFWGWFIFITELILFC
jgi:hypothetical protein